MKSIKKNSRRDKAVGSPADILEEPESRAAKQACAKEKAAENESDTPQAPAKKKHRFLRIRSFRAEMTIIIFLLMTLTSGFTVAVYALLSFLIPALANDNLIVNIAASLIACTVIATLITLGLSKWFFGPLKEMIEATNKIARGHYKIHLQEHFDEKSDIGKLQRSFNHMAAELDGVEMFRNDFINNFSHEFKTPIVSLQGFARQLQAGGLTEEEQREYIDIIVVESDRLSKMANNVLTLSKLENQQIVTDKVEFDLDEQIRTCLLLLEKQWSSKDIELNIDLDDVQYRFNEDMLSQVWINLFSNAFKFTPRAGSVSCTLRETPEAVVVTISDTGNGMDEKVRGHIFEKFYQGDQSRSGEGNGIGLTIVGRVLELCGGRISVDSAPGMGSTFTVTLPVTVTPPPSPTV